MILFIACFEINMNINFYLKIWAKKVPCIIYVFETKGEKKQPTDPVFFPNYQGKYVNA